VSEIPFFKTAMGRQYYDRTLPDLVKAVERVAAALERDDLGPATDDLLDAVDELFETEIVPGSERTREAFGAVRERAQALRKLRCPT